MATDFFINLSLILLIAIVISTFTRLLKQPLLIGYIITGIIVGPYVLNVLVDSSFMSLFSQLGVAFLLFMVGLHLNPKIIREVGWVSLATGVGQVFFCSIIGFFIAKGFGFTTIISLYVAMAMTFSSTIIVMKLLSDKKDLDTLYGRISVGFLIVQDLIAVLVLMVISSISVGQSVHDILLFGALKGVGAIVAVLLVGYFILPRLTYNIAKSQEFLFLFSIGWCFVLAGLFQWLGFSIEIGALLAGVTLSLSPYSNEISSKMKPLRDFFLVLFFVILGSKMTLGHLVEHIWPIITFSLLVLIGNPLIVIMLMSSMGYTKRNSFLAGLGVAQIGEFSLILIALGVSLGHIPAEIISMITAICLITMAGSTYLVMYGTQIYPALEGFLSMFERKNVKQQPESKKSYDVILFGYNRIGFNLLRSLKKINKSYLVVDFNPETIKDLKAMRVPGLYGDAYDVDFLDSLPLEKTQMVISTIPDFDTNLLLVEKTKKDNKEALIIVRASRIADAMELYEKGASYVLTPHFLGGEYLSEMIRDVKTNEAGYKKEKEKHMDLLKKMLGQRPERRNEPVED